MVFNGCHNCLQFAEHFLWRGASLRKQVQKEQKSSLFVNNNNIFISSNKVDI